jgi:hypothetical protein
MGTCSRLLTITTSQQNEELYAADRIGSGIYV